MKKALILPALILAFGISANAQLTPEGVMATLPDMPSAAQMIAIASGELDSDLYREFQEKLNDAQKKCQEMMDKITESTAYEIKNKAMQEKVAGTNITAAQAQSMSKEELQAMARSVAMSRAASAGAGAATVKSTNNAVDNRAVTAVLQKITSLQKRIAELTQKSIRLRNEGESYGKNLYAKEYKNRIESLEAEISALSVDMGGGEEHGDEAARGLAAGAKANALNKQIDGFRHDFYSKAIPVWRNAVTASMDVFRTEILPLQYELKEAYAKAYELTGKHEYLGDGQLPFSAAFGYLDAAGYIDNYNF